MKKMGKTIIYLLIIIVSVGNMKANDNTEAKTRKWYIPSHATVQYAGEIGFLSIGTGFNYANNKLQTELLYGFVGEKHGGEDIAMLTLKQTFTPWNLNIPYKGIELKPLTINIGFTYYFGDEYNKYSSSQYEEGYYWFMKGIRTSGSLGSELYLPFTNKKKRIFKGFSIYYELVTTDLNIYNYVSNLENAKFKYIVSSAIGVRFKL